MSNLTNEICSHIIKDFNKKHNKTSFSLDFDHGKEPIYSSKFKKDDFELIVFYFKIPEDNVILKLNKTIIGLSLMEESLINFKLNKWMPMSFGQQGSLLNVIEDFKNLNISIEENILNEEDKILILEYINYIFDILEQDAKSKDTEKK